MTVYVVSVWWERESSEVHRVCRSIQSARKFVRERLKEYEGVQITRVVDKGTADETWTVGGTWGYLIEGHEVE